MDSVGNWYKARAIDKKSIGALLIIVITMALLTAAFYIVRLKCAKDKHARNSL